MSSESYAIIQTGGKQYRVAKDDIIDVELLDVDPGQPVEFSEVLFFQDGQKALIGKPTISGQVVKGELLAIAPGPKVTSIKYKKRKGQHTKWGHRQKYSRVKITSISGDAHSEAAAPKPKKAAAKKEKA